ncbi:MAG: hypothetical protein ACR2GU_16085, partial [Rubrobacteraceae bacterium]
MYSRSLWFVGVLAAALIVLASSQGFAQEVGTSKDGDPTFVGPDGKKYVAGQIIVKIKEDASLKD